MWRCFCSFQKTGKRFGFVRFKGVKDINGLWSSLTDLSVRDQRLFIKPARFLKPTGVGQKQDAVKAVGPGTGNPPILMTGRTIQRREGKSYREALLDTAILQEFHENVKESKCIKVEEVKEGELQWLARCALGEVKSPDILPDISFLLKEAGFLTTKAKYVGGLRYLLEFDSPEIMADLLRSGREALSNWFVSVQPWHRRLEDSRPGRICWISIRGVPVHLWNEDNFRKIASEWGEVIEVEDLTSQHEQVHIGRVCILVQDKCWVNGMARLCCDGVDFAISVIEDNLEIVDFGVRYTHSQGNSFIPATPDDAQSVAESEPASESESEKDSIDESPFARFGAETIRRTACDSELTLGIEAKSKRVGKSPLMHKEKGLLLATSTGKASAKGAQQKEVRVTPIQISQASQMGWAFLMRRGVRKGLLMVVRPN